MWSRVLVVGSLALSQRILPSQSLGFVSIPHSSPRECSKTYAERDSSSTPYTQSDDTCPDGTASSTLLATSGFKFSFDNYHLIWSPNAWKKLLGTTAVMLLLPRIQLPITKVPFSNLYQNFVLPSLASSCCLLQLGLNILSVGCAGWNSYLGPVRPYFLGVLLVSSFRNRPSTSTLIWRSAVALLPEAVYVYNTWQQSKLKKDATKFDNLDQFVLSFDIPTMGCVACINAIDSKVRNLPGVLQVASELKPLGVKGGSATVIVATDDTASMTNLIIDTVADAGFDGAFLTSLSPKTKS